MSLTQTAYATRNLIKYGGVSLVAFVLLWSIGSVSIKLYKAAHPIYVAPTVKYGILPKNVFPPKEFATKNFSFEFANDLTPSFSDQAKVYVIYRSTVEILALEEAKSVAKEFGFKDEPTELSKGVYEFKNDKNKTLTMDVLKGDFSLKYSYADDPSILDAEDMPIKSKAIDAAASFLEAGKKYTDDLKNGEKETSYWKITDGTLTAVSAQSEANAIKVDFYRQLLDDKWKIVSPQNGEASVSILVSGSGDSDKKVIEANFKYANIGRESYSTYPIKTSAEAMDNLKAGNYWPASDISSENVIIRDIQLAYYEPVILTQYLQPIYVFKGDNNFVAYVSAVADSYISN